MATKKGTRKKSTSSKKETRNESEELRNLVKTLFKDDYGNPVELTDGQLEIFEVIARKTHPRNQIKCFTRYGKSFTVALAVLLRASTYPEKWAIMSGTKEKAKIIMNYINAHIFDNEFTAGRFRMDKGDSAEAIKRHRNKSHITFVIPDDKNPGKKLLGEIYIGSAKEAIGQGAANVVEDEASLIPDNEHALVQRMLGDNPEDNFLVKIGNPFFRNHFLKSEMDPNFNNINIDCYRGLEEGRITQAMIDEAKQYSYFDVLYENKFPSPETIDEKGWSYALNEQQVQTAISREIEPYGTKRLGVDVARGGGNFNVYVERGDNYAKVLRKDMDNDLMSVVGKTINYIKSENIDPREVYIDDTGVGGGVTDRLHEQGYEVNGVKLGEKAELNKEYTNIRAEAYVGPEGMTNWILRTGMLEKHKDWIELTRIRFKKDSNGRTKIESKQDMRKRGEESPDVADALMLTFCGKKKKRMNYVDPKTILDQGGRVDYL